MSHSSLPTRTAAFTLVELLVTITILVILATVALSAMSGVQQMAKVQRCKAQIAKIHEIIAEKWESFEGRRYPPLSPTDPVIPGVTNQPGFDRLRKIRATMRMELPDRATDLFRQSSLPSKSGGPEYANATETVSWNMYRKFVMKHAVNYDDWYAKSHWSQRHESSECLYMILSQAEIGEASALEFFSEREIGDTDQDGMPEILDPWGMPIRFIRWPAGFPLTATGTGASVSTIQQVPAIAELSNLPNLREKYPPDAFDVLQVDPTGYFIFSLIISSGPDRVLDILMNQPDGQSVNYSLSSDGYNNNNPYETFQGKDGYTYRLGNYFDNVSGEGVGEDNSVDNIHNHLIETKTS